MPLPEPREPNPDLFIQRTGGGKTSLFGLPFFLVGIGVIILAFIPPEVRGGDPFPLYVAIPFGGVFLCVGGAILFGRQTLLIDRRRGRVEKSWGLLSKTIRSNRRDLKDFDRISLQSEIRRTDKSTYTVYPIRLQGPNSEDFTLSEPRQESEARTQTEALAKFLAYNIYDESAGALRVRDPNTLDRNLKEKFAMGAEDNTIPEPPALLDSRIDFDGTSLLVIAPAPGFKTPIVLAIAAFAFFEIFFLSVFAIPMLSRGEAGGIPVFMLAFFCLMFLGFPTLAILFILNRALGTQTLRVTDQNLEVVKGWIFKKRETIPSDRIEECLIGIPGSARAGKAGSIFGPRHEIIAVSDDKRISFGSGLKQAELEYVLALAKGILVS